MTVLDPRQRWVARLRALSALGWLVVAVVVFGRPLDAALGHHLAPAFEAVGVDHLLGNAPARGFLLQITTRPSGARVLVADQERARTPALLNISCRQGDPVAFVVELDGHQRVEHQVECRDGGRLVAEIPLVPTP